jgi:peptidoglycan/xylan/chitin deacetylase (PgdA/CDA1 family)
VYHQAFPVLQRYGMSATVFVTTGESKPTGPAQRLPSCEGQPMLSWREIREMHHWGLDIGAHTCTHPDLTHLPTEQIETEIADSKAIIEGMLGAPVRSFAYPYGHYDQRSREVARQHFACACSSPLALVTARSDPYALERVDAYYLRPDGWFGIMLTHWFPWYVRARSIARGLKRVSVSRSG